MSGPVNRLSSIVAHLSSSPSGQSNPGRAVHLHSLSPTAFLPRAAAIEPDAEAIYHVTVDGKVLRRTYRQFSDRACGLAFYLKSRNLRRVGIVCPNTPAFLESIFAISAAGGVSVGVNYRLKPDDIEYILDHADVDCVIVDRELEPVLDQFKASHPTVAVLVDWDTDAVESDSLGPFDAAIATGMKISASSSTSGWAGLNDGQPDDENSLIALAYTSGTTARPKGVMFSHRGAYLAAIANVVESGLVMDNTRCRYLWTLPLFHATGWTFPWAITAARGTHVCLRKIDYPLIWNLLRNEAVTHFNAAPTVNTLLCADANAVRLDRVVRATVAGSPPTAHLFATMENLNLRPVHVYGLTETYGPITKSYHLPSWDSLDHDSRCGKLARQGHGFLTSLPGRVLRIDPSSGTVPKNADGSVVIADVAADGVEVGEIAFEGNICSSGYYKDPVATAALFAGGVLHTGDLAVKHPDGAIHILDRQKDIIISGGENISSVALEGMLVRHPDIIEAAVVAVSDSKWGERPKAFVTLRPHSTVSGPDIIRWAKTDGQITGFMIPREVEPVDQLPKTSTGKIRKNLLREWAKTGVRPSE